MINPARFTNNYSVIANSVRPGVKAIREGNVRGLVKQALARLTNDGKNPSLSSGVLPSG